jgi:acetyl-CoA carboxylase carboxyl transferase subunit alpha
METSWLDFEKPIVELEQKILDLREFADREGLEFTEAIRKLEVKAERLRREVYSNLTPWQRVQLARHPRRPYFLDYLEQLFTDFTELHGDRCFGDDGAIVGGPARFEGRPVMVLGQQKGRNTREKMARNFGMPHPEGYRKALRLMRLAEKFGMPVITFVDTPGAYPGVGAEERGISEAIARNLRDMAGLGVPILVLVIGEGGSGGALAIAVGDRILMLENSVYSVITAEGCAAILWKDQAKAPDAAAAMKVTAQDILNFGIIDGIVPEPPGGAHRDPVVVTQSLRDEIRRFLDDHVSLPVEQLLDARLAKFLRIGVYAETP